MIKKNFFVGACLATLLCFSACDVDEPMLPSFPVSEITLNNVISLAEGVPERVYQEGETFEDQSSPVYYFSGRVARDSYLQNLEEVRIGISPVKEYLSDENFFGYMYGNGVKTEVCSVSDEDSYQYIWSFDREPWEAGTYYYRTVTNAWGIYSTPGILGECLSEPYSHVYSEIKSFTVPSRYLPDISAYYLYDTGIYIRFKLRDALENATRIGICFTKEEKAPVIADGCREKEYQPGSDYYFFDYPEERGIWNVRPYVKLSDGTVVYGFVRKMQI